MDFVKYAGLVLAAIFSPLLILKLGEMIKNILWVYRVKGTFVKELAESVTGDCDEKIQKVFDDHSFPFFPGNIWPTRWIGNLHRRDRAKPLTEWVFRYPNLMVLCAASIVLVCQGESRQFDLWVIRIMSAFIFAGVVVKAVHLLIYRYKFGVMDNWLLSLSVPTMGKTVGKQISRRKSLQNFIGVIVTSLAAFLFGYSAIYYGIAKGMIPGNHFKGICFDSPIWVQSIYFSAATLVTVGFGDISPVGAVAQLVVTSEMLLSLVLLIIFVAAFSATVPTTQD